MIDRIPVHTSPPTVRHRGILVVGPCVTLSLIVANNFLFGPCGGILFTENNIPNFQSRGYSKETSFFPDSTMVHQVPPRYPAGTRISQNHLLRGTLECSEKPVQFAICNFDTFEITHFLVLTFVSLARTRHFFFPFFSKVLPEAPFILP